MMASTCLYLGIDAGGTRCRARLADSDGTPLGDGLAGPATLRLGAATSANAILMAAKDACKTAGFATSELGRATACVGTAGSERPGASEELRLSLDQIGLKNALVVSDAHIACIGAHGGADGGIVIAGTGSIGYGLRDGKSVRVGGHGFPASDEGSGAYIGLHAVQGMLKAQDGIGTATDFTAQVQAALEAQAGSVSGWLASATATDYAALAPIVLNDGGEQAQTILTDAGHAIAGLIEGLHQKGIERIALVGGLSAFLTPYLPGEIADSLMDPKGDALSGALWLCRQSQTG